MAFRFDLLSPVEPRYKGKLATKANCTRNMFPGTDGLTFTIEERIFQVLKTEEKTDDGNEIILVQEITSEELDKLIEKGEEE